MKIKKKLLYRPSRFILYVDLSIVLVVIFATLLLAPFTHPDPLLKYMPVSGLYVAIWLLISYFSHRYKPYKRARYFKSLFRLTFTVMGTVACMVLIDMLYPQYNYSIPVFLFIALNTLIAHLLIYLFYFSVRYAVDYTDPVSRKKAKSTPSYELHIDEHKADVIRTTLRAIKGEKVVEFLDNYLNPGMGDVRLLSKRDYSTFFQKGTDSQRFNAIILLDPLNALHGINTLFYSINQHLDSKGTLVCCFEQKSTRKKRILQHYPPVIRWMVYVNDFFIRRFLPKILLGRRLYYRNFRESYRIFHKTEILGRLCYLGFSILATKKIDGLVYVVAFKQEQLETIPPVRIYGPLIKLRRTGKHGIPIIVYKFRTMYSYSEFLQEYMYENYQLQEGGKFRKDIRISSWGRFLRRYFLDELPMVWNILKGDLKLVGVRPLSKQYQSLYSVGLIELRSQFKPGLLPPFYADMPGTIGEIQQSEKRYLDACLTKGVLMTDLRYFIRIIYNIVFRHAKSA